MKMNINNAGDFVKDAYLNGYLKALQDLADWEINYLNQDDSDALKEWENSYTVRVVMRGKILGISEETSNENYAKVLEAKVNAMATPWKEYNVDVVVA